MATPITIPNSCMILPVNTSSSFKTFTLPVVSTNAGRMIILKDVYGTSTNSSIRLSTIGVDTIELSNVNFTVLANNYGSWWFANDGISRWFFTDAYLNTFYFQDVRVFNITTFSVTNVTVNGNATFVGGQALITSNAGGQAGSMYYNQKVNIQSFTTNFTMRFEQTNADGGTFLIQNSAITALGASGGSLGYQGITPSFAIRFDTWNGATGQFSTDVMSNGSIPGGQGASGVLNTSLGLTAGGTWNFNVAVTYNGTSFAYTITNTANGSNFSSNATVNLPTILGANTAWVGFTGGTGGATELQYVSSWDFAN